MPPVKFGRSRMRHWCWIAARIAWVICAAVVASNASAELSGDSLLGPALRFQPAYDGSAQQRWQMVPVLRYFGTYWFARSTQDILETGLRMQLMPGLHVGAQLAYEPGRLQAEAPFLRTHELPDIDPGSSLGAHLEWDHFFGSCPVTLLLRARRFTDVRRGTQVDTRISAGMLRLGAFATALFAETTWANAQSIKSMYGVNARQADVSGLPEFNAGGGLLSVNMGIGWRWNLWRNWVLVGDVEVHRLVNSVARSPLVERRANSYEVLGVAYSF